MKAFQAFISKPNQLEETFKKIRRKGIPEKFDIEFLDSTGLNRPNSHLYIKLFKKIGLINEQGDPIRSCYCRFVESDNEARLLIGELLSEMYSEIYEADKNAYKLPDEKLRKIFRKKIGEKQSETFIRLIADTYKALAKYAAKAEKGKTKAVVNKNNGTYNGNSSNGVNNVNVEEAKTPAEEFIIELMNDSSIHEYGKKALGKEPQTPEKEANDPDQNNSKPFASALESRSDSFKGQNEYDKFNGISFFLSKILVKRAELLAQMNRREEAVSAYNDIITFYYEMNNTIGIENVSNAYYRKACLQEEMGKFEKALTTFDEFLSTFGKDQLNAGLEVDTSVCKNKIRHNDTFASP